MDLGELRVSAYGLLIKIKVITGWSLPEDEFLDVLVDQFEKKLSESYQNVNVEEMEYAVRTYGTTVKDWGKQMNLSLIDEVMIPYLNKRAEISEIEQQKSVKMIEHKEDLSDQSMEQWIEELKKEKRVDFMPVMVYEWLLKQGLVPDVGTKQYSKALIMAANHRRGVLINEGDSMKIAKFQFMYNDGCFEGEEAKTLTNLAKKFLLMEFINEVK